MKPIRLHDTLTRSIRELHPQDGDSFRFYVCGPTVYAPAHIGNFITFLRFDLLYRVLSLAGLNPFYVRNVTDVDDKTIRDSLLANQDLRSFTDHWLSIFHQDCEQLGLLPPNVEPRATEHIAEQIAMAEKLLENGNAYLGNDGSLYYRVSSFPEYGKLSHFDPEKLRSQSTNSAGTANLADEYDRDSIADFALWKKEKSEDGGNSWDSPWGKGRPGWHLECSAMSRNYLGDTLDLHGGGEDLCFPHHENEIAQTEAVTGKTMSKHWMHSVHLLVEGKKMSKSLGNFYTLGDLLEKGFDPDAIRLAMLGSHYRQQFNFTLKAIEDAGSALTKIRKAANRIFSIAGEDHTQFSCREVPTTSSWEAFEPVWESLADDLNTPAALGKLHSLLRSSQNWDETMARKNLPGLKAILFAFGIDLPQTEEATSDSIPQEIVGFAEKRSQAKKNKDFATADDLRNQIQAAGWQITDTPTGYELKKA